MEYRVWHQADKNTLGIALKKVFWQIKRVDTSLEGIQGGVRRESTSAVELMLHEFRDEEFRDKGEERYGADRWGLLFQPTDITLRPVRLL